MPDTGVAPECAAPAGEETASTEDASSSPPGNLHWIKIFKGKGDGYAPVKFVDVFSEPLLGVVMLKIDNEVYGGFDSGLRILGTDPNNEYRSVGQPNFGKPGSVVLEGTRVCDTWRHELFASKGVEWLTLVYRRSPAGTLLLYAIEVKYAPFPGYLSCAQTLQLCSVTVCGLCRGEGVKIYGIKEDEYKRAYEKHREGEHPPDSIPMKFEWDGKALKGILPSEPHEGTHFSAAVGKVSPVQLIVACKSFCMSRLT